MRSHSRENGVHTYTWIHNPIANRQQENSNAIAVPIGVVTEQGADEGNYLLNVSRRIHFMRAAAVGLLAGGVAVAFQLSLDAAENGRIALLAAMRQFHCMGMDDITNSLRSLCRSNSRVSNRATRTSGSRKRHSAHPRRASGQNVH